MEIFDGATDLGAATLDAATGAWSYTTTLAAGTYSALKAVATDDAGNVATTTAPFTLATGITGQPYSADEQDYSASGVLIGTDYFYTGVTGRSYTAYEDEDQRLIGDTNPRRLHWHYERALLAPTLYITSMVSHSASKYTITRA